MDRPLTPKNFSKRNSKENVALWYLLWQFQVFCDNKTKLTVKFCLNTTLQAFYKFGCNTSIQLHFFSSPLDKLPENLRAISNKQGYQDI